MRGTVWLAIKSPLQILVAFWSIPLIQQYIGQDLNGAYVFAWGFGFVQFLLEFGMSSALQRQVSDYWTRGDRAGVQKMIACGVNFYTWIALIQIGTLLVIAYGFLPYSGFDKPAEYRLILQLLWLQIVTAPFFGLSMVINSVLQAARRFEFQPKLEMLVVVLRFAILWVGAATDTPFFPIVVAMTAVQVLFLLGPGIYVVVKELGFTLNVRGTTWKDYDSLWHISRYMFLIQLSVVLADKVDTTILGYAITDPGPATTIYQNVSKAFIQIRQTGWTLTCLVLPAVASLIAAKDLAGLDRIKYDGSRFLVGLLLPVAILAGIYAEPFLILWVGPAYAAYAWLMQLFLVACLPLVISVLVQTSIAMGKIEVIAMAALFGSLVNLPLSYLLTVWLGVQGVIWGTVLTTLFSNLLVPGLHVFKELEIDPREFLRRTLGPPLIGAACLIAACLAFQLMLPAMPPPPGTRLAGSALLAKFLPFLTNLSVGILAYLVGYNLAPSGRSDLAALARKLTGRFAG